jgi:hypothetical protein
VQCTAHKPTGHHHNCCRLYPSLPLLPSLLRMFEPTTAVLLMQGRLQLPTCRALHTSQDHHCPAHALGTACTFLQQQHTPHHVSTTACREGRDHRMNAAETWQSLFAMKHKHNPTAKEPQPQSVTCTPASHSCPCAPASGFSRPAVPALAEEWWLLSLTTKVWKV